MSGSFLDMDVPPTLVSFAIAPEKVDHILSPEFKEAGNPVCLFRAPEDDFEGIKRVWAQFHQLVLDGKVKAAWAVTSGGVAEAVMKMSFGNEIGFAGVPALQGENLFGDLCGSIVAELTEPVEGVEEIGAAGAEEAKIIGSRPLGNGLIAQVVRAHA